MAETLTQSYTDEEFEALLEEGLGHDEESADIFSDDALAEAYEADPTYKAYKANLGMKSIDGIVRAPAAPHEELLLEAGTLEPMPDPRVSSLAEPSYEQFNQSEDLTKDEQDTLDNFVIPSSGQAAKHVAEQLSEQPREARVPLHANTLHEEETEPDQPEAAEAKESISMDERFTRLLDSANKMLERRKEALTTGKSVSSFEDFSEFQSLYDQYKDEGLDQGQLDLIAKFVTGAFDVVDGRSVEAEVPVAEAAVEAPIATPENDVIEGAYRIGDTVKVYVDGAYEDNWIVSNAYIDEQSRKVAAYQLKSPDGRILDVVRESDLEQWRAPETATPTPAEDLTAPYSTEVRNRPVKPLEQQSDERIKRRAIEQMFVGDKVGFHADEGVIDSGWLIMQDRMVKNPDTGKMSHEYEIGKGEQRLTGVRAEQLAWMGPSVEQNFYEEPEEEATAAEKSPLDRVKEWWAKSRDALKRVNGEKFWKDRWPKRVENPYAELPETVAPAVEARRAAHRKSLEEMTPEERERNPNARRRMILIGIASLAALGVGVGVLSSMENVSATPPEAAPDATNTAEVPSSHASGDILGHTDAPAATAESLNTKAFSIQSGEGGIELFDKLGLKASDWQAAKKDLATRFPNEFYMADNGTRMVNGHEELIPGGPTIGINHTGELPKAVQQYITNRFKG